jgi:glycosyltransferase involved in cell wall biosynthesis
MQELPLISIVTVVYNASATFEKTIKSVGGSTYSNIEYIVVDGGSRDGTIDIIKRNRHIISKWVSEPDKGIYDAMNKGVGMATGKWIIFLGADDILNNVIPAVAEQLKNENTIYYGDVYMTGSQLIYAGVFTKFKIAYKNICHQSIFYPRSVFEYYDFNLSYKIHADYDLNLRCFVDKRFSFKYINIIISEYCEAGFSTKNTDSFYAERRFKILQESYPLPVFWYAKIRYWIRRIVRREIN